MFLAQKTPFNRNVLGGIGGLSALFRARLGSAWKKPIPGEFG